MVPTLYDRDGMSLLEYLADATVCEVTEERNGVYELYMEIPTSSFAFQTIENDMWIRAKPSENGLDQLFRIYNVDKSMTGKAIINAEHQSYLLNSYPVDSVDVTGTATAAMNAILARAGTVLGHSTGFSAVSNVESSLNFSISAVSARAALGGTQGSVLQRYGGEFEFDGKIVRLMKARGSENGVRIAYAKNLTGLNGSISTENSYTALFPFVKMDDVTIMLPEKILQVANESKVQPRVMLRDFSQDVGENPTVAKLRTIAEKFLTDNNINAIKISLDVNFIHLWKSPEWEQYKDLERVSLCDIVTVRHEELGVDVTAKVVEAVYDSIGEKYVRLTVGSVRSGMAAALQKVQDAIDAVQPLDISAIQMLLNQAVDDATNAITGQTGGKVILNPARNPQELLVLTDANSTIQTAQRLWRWNAGGFGYSSNGYNGPFRTAITADGQIVADFITAGTMTANVIRAGTLRSVSGSTWINLENDTFSFANGLFTYNGTSLTITSADTSFPYETRMENGYITFYYKSGGASPVWHGFITASSNFEGVGEGGLGVNSLRPSGFVGDHGVMLSARGGPSGAGNYPSLFISSDGNNVMTGQLSFVQRGNASTYTYGLIDAPTGNLTLRSSTDSNVRLSAGYQVQFQHNGSARGFFDVIGGNMVIDGSYYASGGSVYVGSKEDIKEDINFAKSGLEIITKSGIYSYRLKREKKVGRHYGLVLGAGYKTPSAVTAETGEHVDIYSMISLGWRAIQELSEKCGKYEKRLAALERRVPNGRENPIPAD